MTDTAEATPALPARRPRRGLRRLLALSMLSLGGPLVLAAGGAYYYVVSARYATTENAYVKADKVAISPDISGRVVEVAVGENDQLKAGRLLFRLDEEPFRIALAQAEARLNAARQEIEALHATYRQKMAEYRLAQSDTTYYRRQFERYSKLIKKGIVAETKYEEAERNVRMSDERVAAIKQDMAQVLAQLGGSADRPVDEQPRVRMARAARDQAALDLKHTSIFAPVAGTVTNFSLQVGEYVEAGKPVFTLVRAGAEWVQANFKETDLTYVRVGQPAVLTFDAYPGRVRHAVVASISPATGAEFALLPPQNALGNWVKVVQRLPVRLELTGKSDDPPLRAGMSVIVEIDTGHERTIPSFVKTALAWVKGDT